MNGFTRPSQNRQEVLFTALFLLRSTAHQAEMLVPADNIMPTNESLRNKGTLLSNLASSATKHPATLPYWLSTFVLLVLESYHSSRRPDQTPVANLRGLCLPPTVWQADVLFLTHHCFQAHSIGSSDFISMKAWDWNLHPCFSY